MSYWGKNVQLQIFGESHGPCVGATISGLPSGIWIDESFIDKELHRRRPGNAEGQTKRIEKDEYTIVSGVYQGYTTGTPLTVTFKNKDTRSHDYKDMKVKLRPSHADYTQIIKSDGFADRRGGGHSSGRLTVGIVFAGALAKLWLREMGIHIESRLLQVGALIMQEPQWVKIADPILQVESKEEVTKITKYLLEIAEQKDSVGGVVTTRAIGMPPGVGETFFDCVEGRLASLLFAIPGVKGVEFGSGFNKVHQVGSVLNDSFIYENQSISTTSNHSGGIQGGITNGMPIQCQIAFKPTPTIGIEQKTVDISAMEATKLEGKGRHDVCYVTRALPVVEASMALGLLDLIGDANDE